jgi:hypothetical protein
MTHYNISYEGLDPIEKQNKAIADIKEYMGEAKFVDLTSKLRAAYPDCTIEQFTLMVSFAGVQGYPVKAWYNYTYGL